jgi:hypothetical protein
MNAAGGLQSPRESIEPAKLNLAAAAAFKPDQQWPARVAKSVNVDPFALSASKGAPQLGEVMGPVGRSCFDRLNTNGPRDAAHPIPSRPPPPSASR